MPEDDVHIEIDKSEKTGKKGNAEDELTMAVRVASPFKVYFDEKAYSLSGENDTGEFDILPHHHNFITLLGACELAIRTRSGVSRVKISGGLMHVKADLVVIFLNV